MTKLHKGSSNKVRTANQKALKGRGKRVHNGIGPKRGNGTTAHGHR
jgi:hypothetical protein